MTFRRMHSGNAIKPCSFDKVANIHIMMLIDCEVHESPSQNISDHRKNKALKSSARPTTPVTCKLNLQFKKTFDSVKTFLYKYL